MTDGSTGATARPTLLARLVGEFRLFFTLFLYLWVLLGVFVLNQNIARRQDGDTFMLQGFALVNALVLGKVMMIAEHLDFARWLRSKPAIYSIVLEALLCTLLFIGFHIVERLAIEAFRGGGHGEGVLSMGGGGLLGVALVAAVLFISLIPFFAFKNVTRILGWPRMRAILFGRPEKADS